MVEGETAGAPEWRVPVPSAILALPSASYGLDQATVLGISGDTFHAGPDLRRSIGQQFGAHHNTGAAGVPAVESFGQRGEACAQSPRAGMQRSRPEVVFGIALRSRSQRGRLRRPVHLRRL